MNSEWHHRLTIEDMRLLGTSTQLFLDQREMSSSEGALLPPDFLAPRLEQFEQIPDWLGFLALRNQVVIGSGGFKSQPCDGWVEIGYGIAEEFQNQGCATRLTAIMVDYAFRSGQVEKVVAHTLPDGVASQKVLARNGFTFVGIHEDPEDGIVNRYEVCK
jgi:[ribosomal protein S5]-alanine N-acetyltransferase